MTATEQPRPQISDPSLPPELRSGVWVVIPAFNEAAQISQVVTEIARAVDHPVVVDDGSSDGTAATARAAGARVLRHLVNRGQGAALQTGITFALRAGARFIVTFDADGQHRIEDLPALLRPLFEGEAEIALGSRFLGSTEVPPLRRLLLRSAVLFTRLTSGLRVTDAHNGLRAFTRAAASSIRLRLDRMAHASEIMDQIADSGLAWVEVPVWVRYTVYSRAKGQRGWAAVRVALDYLVAKMLG